MASLRRVGRPLHPVEPGDAVGELVEVVELDRATIAARLHEGPVQTLTAASLRLQSAVHFDELTADVAREVAAGIAEAAVELRILMSALVAWEVGTGPLEKTLRRRVEDACASSGVDARVHIDLASTLDEASGALVLRLAQDAVADAIHRAGASELELSLGLADGCAALDVRHDGTPADAATPLGLRLLRRRVESASGSVDVEAGAGGTAIRIVVPVGAA